jgi:cellulose synthase/poly-beta-1,6-N-acetylglucosamine synthase-like glycosyltransferase
MPQKILILTPFRNEDHAVSQYLESLESVDYPKNLIDVYWLENDSTDKTLKMLKDAKPKMPFNSTTLESINILGPLKKRPPGEYLKDIGHGTNRKITWPVIWNNHFLPLVRKSRADYVLIWFADIVPPPNVITEYLKVFSEYKDAGWVGGAMHRRYPREQSLHCPIPTRLAHSKKIVKVIGTGHCVMCPRPQFAKTQFRIQKGFDLHITLINQLAEQGLYAYYQPSIFLKHVSTDGKIHRHKLVKFLEACS